MDNKQFIEAILNSTSFEELKKKVEAAVHGAPKAISEFSGKYHYLSNFAPSPITFSGKTWPTVEHAFQAAKTNNPEEREKIRTAKTAADARTIGRNEHPTIKVKLRPDWETVKQGMMLKILRLKFNQNPELKKKLLETGTVKLIEGNTWHDNYWGDCLCQKCKEIVGGNTLGDLLEFHRDLFRKELAGNSGQ